MVAKGNRRHQHVWQTVRDHVTHWLVGGVIIAATGTAPEEWFGHALHALHIPGDALHLWAMHLDLRAVIVFIGVAIIVADLLRRPRGQTRAAVQGKLGVAVTAPISASSVPGAEAVEQGGSAETLRLPDKPSIAVLPFANMGGNPNDDYLSDGIAEEIITLLSCSQSLFVIARNSSFTYKGHAVDVKEIARALGVRYVLEGSVRRGGDHVRITASLIDAVTGNHMWAKHYDREPADVFAVQDELSEAVAIAIEPAVASLERHRAVRTPPENLGAWEAYQRGLWHMGRIGVTDNEAAKKFFRRAIDLDRHFAAAHAQLAIAIFQGASYYQATSLAEAVDQALPLAQRAIGLDPLGVAGHIGIGVGRLFQGDFDGMFAAAHQALDVSPNYATAHHLLGTALLFSSCPREAIEAYRKAIRLDPYDPFATFRLSHIATAYYFLRDYAGAIGAAKEGLRSHPDHPWIHCWLAAALGQIGRLDEAKQALQKATTIAPKSFDMYVRERVPWMRGEDYEHVLEGLRKAGWEG
jgi:adenylate cyclase